MSHYRIREFTATSGNHCRLKVYPIQPNGNVPVDVSWDKPGTGADIDECNAWFEQTMGPQLSSEAGRPFAGLFSFEIEDSDERRAFLRSLLHGSN